MITFTGAGMKMTKKTSPKISLRSICVLFTLLCSGDISAMVELENEQLAEVTGQALIQMSKAPGISGSNTSFYRASLDVELALNMNIEKMQLGCTANSVNGQYCDIDMEQVRLMGRYSGSGSNPLQPAGSGRAGDPVDSDFILNRPFFDFAIKNDDTATLREVLGIKLSAETADGYFGVGGIDSQGDHFGLNSMSGYLDVYLNAYVRFTTTLGNGQACIGRPDGYSECAGNSEFYNIPTSATTGKRLTELYVESVEMNNLHGASGILRILEGADMYAIIRARLNELHGFELNTPNFFLSLQNEDVRWTNFDNATYAATAEAGWWMNVPRVELRNLEPDTVPLGCPGFFCLGLLGSFSEPGINAGYPDLQSVPPNNCRGSARFC